MRDTSVDRAIQKALERASQEPQGRCPDHNQLAAYLESRCAAPEKLRLQEHLSTCGTCQQILALSLKLSESAAGDISQPNPAPRRLSRLAIPVSALVAAAVLLGIVVVYQRKSVQPVNQTAEIRSIPSVPARSVPQLPPAGIVERKEADLQSAAKLTARKVQSPARTAQRPELPVVGVPARTDSEMAKAQEVGIANAVLGGKAQPSAIAQASSPEESTRLADAMTAKQVKEERAAFKDRVIAQNELVQLQQRAPAPAQAQGLSQARQVSPAPAVITPGAAPGFVARPQEAIAEFSSASTPTRNALAVRRAGEKVFYQWSAYWIDGECAAHAKAPLAEIAHGSKEYEELAGQFPILREFEAAAIPVLLYWNGKNYEIR